MKTEDTFSLTSVKEDRPMGLKIGFATKHIKLPHIKSQQSFSKPSKSMNSVPSTLKKNPQSTVTHELLKSITDRASQ